MSEPNKRNVKKNKTELPERPKGKVDKKSKKPLVPKEENKKSQKGLGKNNTISKENKVNKASKKKEAGKTKKTNQVSRGTAFNLLAKICLTPLDKEIDTFHQKLLNQLDFFQNKIERLKENLDPICYIQNVKDYLFSLNGIYEEYRHFALENFPNSNFHLEKFKGTKGQWFLKIEVTQQDENFNETSLIPKFWSLSKQNAKEIQKFNMIFLSSINKILNSASEGNGKLEEKALKLEEFIINSSEDVSNILNIGLFKNFTFSRSEMKALEALVKPLP